ncbi:AcrR family transcriptional regulator [Friedmanniella endophytica]|uniref:AcrR family transcriptional regulator n=1 Tax=Microlunatus kandeliicorticis TaxID=1759536 RepID=A0A7W3IUY5_9ACTN|nr:helix-turn-helix domain-containing protein [Microlunatus kandeliicorticis]MBA8795650.1 AcrR family transcriptional regulator [Microlunatus kandeliicorticis]
MASQRVVRMPRDQRRAQLLEVARELFAEKGYYAAAMDDIAEAAGVSKPVLYQHFGSKLELYLALLDASCERLTALLARALASTRDNAERVRGTTRAFYEFVSHEGAEFRFVFESDLTAEPLVAERLWRLNDEIADSVALVIAEDTALPPAKAKLLAISLVGAAQVSARYWMSEGREIDAAEAEQLIATLQWRGIGGFPRTEQH